MKPLITSCSIKTMFMLIEQNKKKGHKNAEKKYIYHFNVANMHI